MERLTERFGNNDALPTKIDLDFYFDIDDETCRGLIDIFNRLASYEETGLEPEEIHNLSNAREENETAIYYADEIGGVP